METSLDTEVLAEHIDAQRAFQFLTPLVQDVITMRAQGYSLSDISKKYHRSVEWVRRMEHNGMRRLRNWTKYGIPSARLAWARKKGMKV